MVVELYVKIHEHTENSQFLEHFFEKFALKF